MRIIHLLLFAAGTSILIRQILYADVSLSAQAVAILTMFSGLIGLASNQ